MDAIIIGAGLAGLAAAERLVRAGRSVLVLEARGRVGGRVWTLAGDGAVPLELGPEWLGNGGAVHDLLARHGGRLVEATGQRWRRAGRGWESLEEQQGTVRDLLARAGGDGGPDRSLSEALRHCCADPGLADARTQLLAYVEGFHAADPDQLSLQWLAEVEASDPAEASELRAGAGVGHVVEALEAALAGRCEIRLETVVTGVHWKPGEVRIISVGNAAPLLARAAVVTVPLPVLRTLRFDPDLPRQHEAADRLAMGPVVKLLLRFRESFWRDVGPLGDLLFLHDLDQPFPTWWTAIDPEVPWLTAWAGGPQAARLGTSDEGELVRLALRSLAVALGMSARDVESRLEAHRFHDWSADPFARGAYTYVRPGGAEAWRELSRPAGGTLFFAGEATAGGGHNATVEGAFQSGLRAAEELLAVTE